MLAPALILALLAQPHEALATPEVAHRIEARLEPASASLRVVDEMRLPAGENEWLFYLHAGLAPRIVGGDAQLSLLRHEGHLTAYRLKLHGPGPVTLSYGGRIDHGLEQIDEGMGRARQWTLGTIRPNGVFLDGDSGWYPRIPSTLQRFELDVRLPEDWTAVSQGAGPGERGRGRSIWRESQPQDDIYLVAGPYRMYRAKANGIEAQAYLRKHDPELAQRYLDATHEYIAHYSKLIGPYPFAKFALVENFWETGYGMPSFTLLGSGVIRLPFILKTSFPHEILHNWWGNGVFVDYASGNWSEGLTTYLADYWLRERAGQGMEARRDMLKSYADYVRAGKDFALADFRGKEDMASQGIGYGKAAMFFHMLRGRLGDTAFDAGLRRFYESNRFKVAGYADLCAAFEEASGQPLRAFFDAWTTQPGVPQLDLSDVKVKGDGARYRLTARIRQMQPGPTFPLLIPIVIEQEGAAPKKVFIQAEERQTKIAVALELPPSRLAVDPDFDTFRTLLPEETPVTLSQLFGSEAGLILVPSGAPAPLADAYRALAMEWLKGRPDWRIRADDELESLPGDRPVWLLGWENRHLTALARDSRAFTVDVEAQRISIKGVSLDSRAESVALARELRGQAVAWLGTPEAARLPALARKLPHYGRYSYLVFSGPDSTNRVKGQWSAESTALSRQLTKPSPGD